MILDSLTRRSFGALMLSSVAACGGIPASNPEEEALPSFLEGYGPIFDAGFTLPGIPVEYTQGINRRMEGFYTGEAEPGTIDVDPYSKFLYLIQEDGRAIRRRQNGVYTGRDCNGTSTSRMSYQTSRDSTTVW